MKKNLVFLGMMASGKTTLAKIVAKKLGLRFVDVDSNIVKNNFMAISEIFIKKGEKFFRKEEEKETLIALKKNNCVIALGGGAFINPTIRKSVLENSFSVWLNVNVETLNKRIKKNHKRPLLDIENNTSKLEKLYSDRKKIYEFANHKIECDKKSKNIIVKEIISLYEKY